MNEKKSFWTIRNILSIIGVIALVVLCLLLVKECKKPAPLITINQTQLKQKDSLIRVLTHKNDSLLGLRKQDSIERVHLNADIVNLTQTHVNILAAIKHLTDDASIILSQQNFNDTSEVFKAEVEGKVKVCISVPQLKEVNSTYEDKRFLLQLNDTLDKMASVLINHDIESRQIIKNQKSIIDSKDFIINSLKSEKQGYSDSVDTVKKDMKKQRFWKWVFQGLSALAIGFAIAK